LSGDFLRLWQTQAPIFFGPPISEVMTETVDGRTLQVQYFARWRFEQEGHGPARIAALGEQALRTRQCPHP
jgi:hypothetical protein